MKILITGDRNWDDYETVLVELQKFSASETVLIHGACRGTDIICAEIAVALGFVVKAFPANWEKFGKGAGAIRNQQMITENHFPPNDPIDLCLAFHNDIENSRGTRDMLSRAEKAGIKTKLITSLHSNVILV